MANLPQPPCNLVDERPVMLDLFSGPRAPLAKAFLWCGWRVVTPIDLDIDEEFDVTRPAVQRALLQLLPQVSLQAAAFDCSTKTRAREKSPGPPPLRSQFQPRGLPLLKPADAQRVAQDNLASDFGLAMQAWGANHGQACLRENPLNSLHWHDPCEVHVTESGDWFDMTYDACVFLGARRKAQQIRHNLSELAALPQLRCGHVHRHDEWARTTQGFPTKEEAEYTPSLVFTLAICATAWAAKRGFLVERIHRLPPISTTGDVRSLMDLDPALLRQDLMTPMALHLGLRHNQLHEDWVPARLVAAEVKSTYADLPPTHIYIGPGHFSHRWAVGPWANPFLAGRDGTHFEVVVLYMRWLLTNQDLLALLPELQGKVLVCDCPANRLCHGDVLATAVWQHCGQHPHTSAGRPPVRTVMALVTGTRVVSASAHFDQAEVVETFKAWCHFIPWADFRFPIIADLLRADAFHRFRAWQQSRAGFAGLPSGPRLLGAQERPMFRMSLGTQTGAAASAKAAPPLVPFGLGPDGHFIFARQVQALGTPFELEPLVDDDLTFAATLSATWGTQIRSQRGRSLRLLNEMGRRWQPVTDYMRQFQPPEVASATAGRHLGLIGLLCILMDWPDPTFMHGLVYGFPCVGFSPHLPVFDFQDAEWIHPSELWASARADADRIRHELRPSAFGDAIAEAGAKDEAQGFCGPAMTWSELAACGRPFRLIRRFCIQQPGGKLRVIDDAADGGQSALSSDSNRLDLCTAIQPGIHVRLLWHEFQRLQPQLQNLRFETGGEDLPHAYRHVPMKPEESWACVVAYYDDEKQQPMFRRYFGHLFGLPLAVTSFNRFPRMLQSLFRRLGGCMASMYFDVLTIQDVDLAGGSGQRFCMELAKLLGSPFSEEKHQAMQSEGDFLGLWHNVGDSHVTGGTTFWVRKRLLDKIESYIQTSLRTNSLLPGMASKLFGCLTFLSHGCFGKAGRSGLTAIQERQYASRSQTTLTAELAHSFVMIQGLLRLRPQRIFALCPSKRPRLLAASDAAQDAVRLGSAGALAVTPCQHRLALVLPVDDRLFQQWDSQAAKISQLELCIVMMSLASLAPWIRGHHGVWFIDNVPALMSLIKGRSSTLELDAMAGVVHSILCGLHCCLYFEWVASKDNWSDGISRHGLADPWFPQHKFKPHVIEPLLILFSIPVVALIQVKRDKKRKIMAARWMYGVGTDTLEEVFAAWRGVKYAEFERVSQLLRRKEQDFQELQGLSSHLYTFSQQSCGPAQRMESALLAAERAMELSATRGCVSVVEIEMPLFPKASFMAVLFIAAFAADDAGSFCLSNAVPGALRKKLINSTGHAYEVGLWVSQWPAAALLAAVMHILIEAKIGYNVTETGPGPGMPDR
eukprot:s228_g4.t1